MRIWNISIVMCRPGRHSSFTNPSHPAVLSLFANRLLIRCWLLAVLSFFFLESSFSLGAPPNQTTARSPAQTELALAKTKSLYVTLDLPNKLAVLKARGVPLRTFPLQAIDWIGEPIVQPGKAQLKTKDPMVSPMTISPPPPVNKAAHSETEEVSFTGPPPPKALTVSDMPLRYELTFDERFIIIIQPHHLPTFWDNMVQQVGSWTNRIAAHMANWKGAFGQTAEPYLVLSMEPSDAQAFYWAVLPPMAWIVFPETRDRTP